MSSESGRPLSLEELKQRNRPKQTQSQDTIPTREDWKELLNMIEILSVRLSVIEWYLEESNTKAPLSSMQRQGEELLSILRRMEHRQEQAGKKKERRFSLPRIYFPTLDRIEVIMLLMLLAALSMTCLFLASRWSTWSSLMQ